MHLCAITFFGFACGMLKGLEVDYSQGIPIFLLVIMLPASCLDKSDWL